MSDLYEPFAGLTIDRPSDGTDKRAPDFTGPTGE